MNRLQKSLVPVLATAGVLHFVKPEPFDSIVPPQLPGEPRTYTYASGVAELASAALLASKRTKATGGLAAAGLFAAVWPANIYMAWLWRRKPWYLQVISLARIPLQIPLIRAAWGIHRGHS
ncbi:hypothetical protein G7Y29_02275 [Corynebacterium qintianiae]|uniref:DoxX family membrane protein n=1 Tax=Corynebacterium qintianiae TaxID=2709392 RepID=A0A7T0KPJ3_9CORY|nr:hypothetical protein [Corynebacterium qintianiae]QPK83658.1 hypothetical protein G7Y29_02275 [Corynebacterium qintianiae]